MNPNDVYNLCCRYHGKMVRVRCRDGRVHVGEITRVNRNMVWVRPYDGVGGYGLGYYGFYGPGPGYGLGVGVALGTIVGIGLASAFLW